MSFGIDTASGQRKLSEWDQHLNIGGMAMDKKYFEKLKNAPNTLRMSMEFLATAPNGETRSLEEAWKSASKGSTLTRNGKVIATKE